MWALIYSIIVIGTTEPVVYSLSNYQTYVECFHSMKVHSAKLRKNEALHCIMIK